MRSTGQSPSNCFSLGMMLAEAVAKAGRRLSSIRKIQ